MFGLNNDGGIIIGAIIGFLVGFVINVIFQGGSGHFEPPFWWVRDKEARYGNAGACGIYIVVIIIGGVIGGMVIK